MLCGGSIMYQFGCLGVRMFKKRRRGFLSMLRTRRKPCIVASRGKCTFRHRSLWNLQKQTRSAPAWQRLRQVAWQKRCRLTIDSCSHELQLKSLNAGAILCAVVTGGFLSMLRTKRKPCIVASRGKCTFRHRSLWNLQKQRRSTVPPI